MNPTSKVFTALAMFISLHLAEIAPASDDQKVWLGASVQPISDNRRAELGAPASFGILTVSTIPGSPAAIADMQPQDVILLLDGAPVDEVPTFVSTISNYPVNSVVTLNVLRDGKEVVVNATLTRRPSIAEINKIQQDLAAQGDPAACVVIGRQLLRSEEAAKKIEALRLFQVAADKGDSTAKAYLGYWMIRGYPGHKEIVKLDPVIGVRMLKESAEKECSVGLRLLSECYLLGAGVPPDEKMAFQLSRRALDIGGNAELAVADCYYFGKGVDRDYLEAARLYRIAADRGESIAQVRLAQMYYDGVGLTQDYKEAFALNQLAAEQGVPFAIRILGNMYMKGQGVAKNEAKAVELYRQGAELEEVGCISNLGMCYENGLGVPKDEQRAAKLFHQAALMGEGSSMYNLAVMIVDGRGYKRNYETARAWFDKALEAGVVQAHIMLAFLDSEGLGGPRDRQKAIEHCLRAKEAGLVKEAEAQLQAICGQ